ASLLLQLGSAPRRLYVEFIEEKFKKPLRILERMAVRPIVVGLLLRVSEIVLERVALGFSWIALLFFDYEMANLDGGKEYPKSVISRRDVTKELRPMVRASEREFTTSPGLAIDDDADALGNRHVSTLRENLQNVGESMMSQVKLRHSLYYCSDVITDYVADALVEN
ncbi:MAG: hypothetical protein V3T31_00270, partial [candidate division Zixibacteria bacterium]